MALQYFVPHTSSELVYEYLLDWVVIIGIFALALGMGSLVTVSVSKIKQKQPNWQYAYITLAGLIVMLIAGLFSQVDGSWGIHPLMASGLQNPVFNGIFRNVITPIQSSTFALLAFFIASAAYRAFRARNVLATLLLLAALIVMLRFNPFLGGLTPIMDQAAGWLLNVPNLAAKRAILIGVGLGIVATALKVVLGIERGFMGKS
jgi:hypothetical protein